MTWNIKVVLNKQDEKKKQNKQKGIACNMWVKATTLPAMQWDFFVSFLEGLNIVKYKCVLNKISHSFWSTSRKQMNNFYGDSVS